MSALMLSPKMQHRIQRGVRINDGQLLGIAEKAKYDSRKSGYLFKRSSDGNRWLRRWFRLYQVMAKMDLLDTRRKMHHCDVVSRTCCFTTTKRVQVSLPGWSSWRGVTPRGFWAPQTEAAMHQPQMETTMSAISWYGIPDCCLKMTRTHIFSNAKLQR